MKEYVCKDDMLSIFEDNFRVENVYVIPVYRALKELHTVTKKDICREFYEKLMKRLDYDCVFTRQEIINNAVMVFEELEQGE